MHALLHHFHIPGCRRSFKVLGFYDDKQEAQEEADRLFLSKSKYACTIKYEVREIGNKFMIPDISFKNISGVKGDRAATSLGAELQHWIPRN